MSLRRNLGPRRRQPELFREGQHGHHQWGRHAGDLRAERQFERDRSKGRHPSRKPKEKK